ncbi:hypothetical protein [Dendronalium sp. ChiSLP03b]|uniref:hypothetical protein n=1 Tax=Dendronalium sp. ChiSLP03b TaxID=3075381 RepID=UPI002AD259A3|nr:hypothetical protein [Dendronalium sp. ChiSLP03b]MDZ8206398.1 hypothetical protein [Dendronalium sp. ChiSLP03b]
MISVALSPGVKVQQSLKSPKLINTGILELAFAAAANGKSRDRVIYKVNIKF